MRRRRPVPIVLFRSSPTYSPRPEAEVRAPRCRIDVRAAGRGASAASTQLGLIVEKSQHQLLNPC